MHRCGNCHATIPHLAQKRKIGWCHQCGEWLGVPLYRDIATEIPEQNSGWSHPEGGELGKLYSALQHNKVSVQRTNINKLIAKCILYIDGKYTDEDGWVGPCPPQLKNYLDHPFPIEMAALLYVCECFNISILDFFQGCPPDIVGQALRIPTGLVLNNTPVKRRIEWTRSDDNYRHDAHQAFSFFRYALRTIRDVNMWSDLREYIKNRVGQVTAGEADKLICQNPQDI